MKCREPMNNLWTIHDGAATEASIHRARLRIRHFVPISD